MDVKEAVSLAKQHTIDLFQDENPTDIGLEEVEFNDTDHEWCVTVGFSRPWDVPRTGLGPMTLSALSKELHPRRTYKVVRIDDSTKEVVAVKNREVPA